ncbi:hydrogenase expression/formation protein HupK [Frigidibacter sp. MR17.14]|uniref:hydrogenase expression/formation protein HupK n=1 Tax=Frigidibacter sp. MR17.14 TaxID=3126509 RepID=UPI003012BC63
MDGGLCIDAGGRVRAGPAVPVAALVFGRPVAEAVEILPRIFALCRQTQAVAVLLALGLTLPEGAGAALNREILRDHLARLLVLWPRAMGLPGAALPEGWDDPRVARAAIFGAGRGCPASRRDLDRWLLAGEGAAPLVAALQARFGRGTACSEGHDNSAAGRHAGVTVMREIAAAEGQGPLWRAMGRLLDIEAVLAGRMVPARRLAPGEAFAPSARGAYRLRAEVTEGRVTGLERRTPTDDMAAPGGPLEQALATTPPRDRALVVTLFDPCVPVRFAAEAGHA